MKPSKRPACRDCMFCVPNTTAGIKQCAISSQPVATERMQHPLIAALIGKTCGRNGRRFVPWRGAQ